ncbi:MAG TPA: sigma-70 family RNA polymerase sigma factor [Terriglobales bacterium]|nr:sigma-70 family RNA polymerase sigma factor [Terriglobales bacterium]
MKLSLFQDAVRSIDMSGMDMIGAAVMGWEVPVGLEADVAQLRRGDLDALSALITRYQNRLYRFLLRLVHDKSEAEDLFQQTWVHVAEKIRHFDPSRNFDAWLFTVARNLAIDHLRRVRPASLDQPVSEDESQGTAVDRLVANDPAPLDRVLANERATRLGTALDELPIGYREVMTLRFEEEMKIEEIAQVLSIPLSTVKSRLRRSLEQMRQSLETRYAGENWR